MKSKKHVIFVIAVIFIACALSGLIKRIERSYVSVSSGRIRTIKSNCFFTYSEEIVDTTLTSEARQYGIEFPPEHWVLTQYDEFMFFGSNKCSSTRNSRLLYELGCANAILTSFNLNDHEKCIFIELFLEWMRRGEFQDDENTPSHIWEESWDESVSRKIDVNYSDKEQPDSKFSTPNEIDPDRGFHRFVANFLSAFERSIYPEKETTAEPSDI